MKKAKMKESLNAIAKTLGTSSAAELVRKLTSLVDDFQEEELKHEVPRAQSSKSEFSLTDEVRANSNALALFTDGACRGNPGPGSYGFVVQAHTGDIILEGAKAFEHTTNNKMELSGVIEGIKALKDQLTPFTHLYVYTDSKYVVDGMKSWVAGWKKRGWKKADKKTPENVDRWMELDQLSSLCHFHFIWIKGHAGHPQNEYVDGLANIALDESGY